MTANKISKERAERVRLVLVATFFVQSMVVTAIIVRIPEIIENLGLESALSSRCFSHLESSKDLEPLEWFCSAL
jgi:hypothetical protein